MYCEYNPANEFKPPPVNGKSPIKYRVFLEISRRLLRFVLIASTRGFRGSMITGRRIPNAIINMGRKGSK